MISLKKIQNVLVFGIIFEKKLCSEIEIEMFGNQNCKIFV